MQKQSILSLLLPLLLLLSFINTTKVYAVGRGRIVGGRTEVKNVNSNKEIQQLGKFSVEQYNKDIMEMPPGPLKRSYKGPLKFVKVVEAQTQVVSGIKYFLKVEAVQTGVKGTFDVVLVVNPWVHSKQLLKFVTSPRPKLSQAPREKF